MTAIRQTEDREYKRFVINVKVFDQATNECLGYSANMHSCGMMLSSEKLIPDGREFNILIRHLQDDDELIEIRLAARCMWSKSGNNPDFYLAGFQFINPSPKQVLAIDELIWDLAVL